MLSGERKGRSMKRPLWEFRFTPHRGYLFFFLLLSLFLSIFSGCSGRVKKDLTLARDFRPQEVQTLAVINLDSKIQFSHFVEAELLKKGYKVKESSVVAQLLKTEGLIKEGALDPSALT